MMCGLYSFRKSPEETRSLFSFLDKPEFPPRQYVAPGGPIGIVTQGRDGRRFKLVRWGFIPSWVKEVKPGKPLINARGETAAEKPSFRNAMKRRRCLIPADGFYEWEGDVPGRKKPYYIQRKDQGLMGFAGLWEHWAGADGSELETAVIITTEANPQVGSFHPRSPVVIEPQDFERWLDTENVTSDIAATLLKPVPDGYWHLEPTTIERRPPPPRPAIRPADQMKLI